MSISSEIQKLQTNLANSYEVCSDKGATMPASQNFDNLADCIDSISSETVVDRYFISNITKRGSLSDNDGLLSNFSNDNYGIINLVPANITSFEFNLDFTTPSDTATTYEQAVIGNSSGNRTTPQIEVEEGLFRMLCSADGSSWDARITCSVVANTHYTAKLLWDGSIISGYIKDDNGNITNLTTETSNSLTSLYWINNVAVGWDGTGTFWKGSINLNNCSIKINGQEVWTGVINQIPVDKYYALAPNYTVYGSPTIYNFVASGFSTSSYVRSTVSTPSSGNFELNTMFTMPSTAITADSPIMSKASGTSGDLYINANQKIGSWNSSMGAQGTTILETGKTYSVKLVSDTVTSVYLKEGEPSSDLNDYTLEYTDYPVYFTDTLVRYGMYGTNQVFPGSIDLKHCDIKVGGTTRWEAVTINEIYM